jgi:hypothetical protein
LSIETKLREQEIHPPLGHAALEAQGSVQKPWPFFAGLELVISGTCDRSRRVLVFVHAEGKSYDRGKEGGDVSQSFDYGSGHCATGA